MEIEVIRRHFIIIPIKQLKAQVNYINTPVKDTRSGKIFMYPSGLVIDSLTKKDSTRYIR